MRIFASTAIIPVLFVATSIAQAPQTRLESLLQSFWDADQAGADSVAQQVAALGTDFEALITRLKAGRLYTLQRTGRIDMPLSDRIGPLDNVVEIPPDYDAGRRWPVRISLHGGVGRERPRVGESARPLTNRTPGGSEIVIHPRAWLESAWWTPSAVDNIVALLRRVKRQYNVDESRVYVTGISDGGTGVYFLAMREATPWSSCLPLNGHPLVLANPETGVDGQLYPHNLANCALFLVNGGKDPLYPARSVQPFVDMFQKGGIPVTFHVYPEAGHDTSWWPQERPRFEAFVAANPRVAHPATVSWETERTDRYNRFRWLVIDRLGARPSDAVLKDVNEYETIPKLMVRTLFTRTRPSGRVDATRVGNTFDVKTRGVRELTLLLSPDVVEFSKPVIVSVNGRQVHNAVVQRSVATLLKWVARDHDRTMLYGAELPIAVP